ncbi:MAG: hypothetical protein E7501_06185, partial [Ruminococcus sp.]|nr:hypothetical protein [Ruminococcus sp.]
MKFSEKTKSLRARIVACSCSLALAVTAVLLQNVQVPTLNASAAFDTNIYTLTGGTDTGNALSAYRGYSRWWASVDTDYLYTEADGTLVRIASDGSSNAYAEYYELGDTVTMKKNIIIPLELPIFGGFYAGETYNYIVTGQTNPNEDDTLPVFAVTKYDKDFNALGHAYLSSCNTTIPFDAGSLRMDEANGTLYIHTCHEMYMKI